MSLSRQCSRTACSGDAIGTLTYVYSEQTAVLGPLATYAEPHTYDLCALHAEGLTVPRGWDVIRLLPDVDPGLTQDDLVALADAVRESGRPKMASGAAASGGSRSEVEGAGTVETARRGHLRILRDG